MRIIRYERFILIKIILFLFSSRYFRSRHLFRYLVKLNNVWNRKFGQVINFDEKRFENSNWISSSVDRKSGYHDKSIELIIVATSKDFDILVHSVNYALKALSDFKSGGVRIVVPKLDIDQCKKMFVSNKEKIKIIDENTIVSSDQFNSLTRCFGTRDTWVLQQILKLQAVINSTADAVLVLDSDTILLRKRPWFDKQGRQVLMPSFEFNPPYYIFLNKLITCKVIPENTFVTHHMIMQPKILNKILSDLNLLNINSLIDYCCIHSDKTTPSPICIEYEIYGQYLALRNREAIFLAQWANATIPKKFSELILKSKVLRYVFSHLFNSISFHSWS